MSQYYMVRSPYYMIISQHYSSRQACSPPGQVIGIWAGICKQGKAKQSKASKAKQRKQSKQNTLHEEFLSSFMEGGAVFENELLHRVLYMKTCPG